MVLKVTQCAVQEVGGGLAAAVHPSAQDTQASLGGSLPKGFLPCLVFPAQFLCFRSIFSDGSIVGGILHKLNTTLLCVIDGEGDGATGSANSLAVADGYRHMPGHT